MSEPNPGGQHIQALLTQQPTRIEQGSPSNSESDHEEPHDGPQA
jgi:hypothetical protein